MNLSSLNLVETLSELSAGWPHALGALSIILYLFSSVCTTVGVGQNGLSQASLDVVFHTLAAALNDYTTDARGDIGVV